MTNISITIRMTHLPRGAGASTGLALPDEVLEKVYYRNAERVICMPV